MSLDIRSFVEPVNQTLRNLGGVESAVTAPAASVPTPVFADVSSQLVLKGTRNVTVVLTMSQRAAVDLAERLGVSPADIDDNTVGDLVGELLNVICGCAQKHERFEFGVPAIETGVHHEVASLRRGFEERLVSQTAPPNNGVGDLELFVVDCS